MRLDQTLSELAEAHERVVIAAQGSGNLTAGEQRALSRFIRLADAGGLTPAARHENALGDAIRARLARIDEGKSPPPPPTDTELDQADEQVDRWLGAMRGALERCLLDAYRRGRHPGRELDRDDFLHRYREAAVALRRSSSRLTRQAVATWIGIDAKTLRRYLDEYGVAWPPRTWAPREA